MLDKRVIEAVRRTATENETPDAVVEAVLRRMLPAVRLEPQPASEEALSLAGCRIGGSPDLPKRVKWPRLSDAWKVPADELGDVNDPFQFVMQVNLAEVAPFDVANVLPKEGLLSFFFYWEPGEWDSDVAFIVYTKSTKNLSRKRWPGDLPEKQRYRPLQLKPRLEWTVPSIEDAGLPREIVNPDEPLYMQNFQHYDFFEDVEENVAQAQGLVPATSSQAVVHRLLGHPKLIQSPGLAEGTRLLLQADSDASRGEADVLRTGMMWGDSGRLYYLIGEDELKGHRLAEEPWVLVEMC